MGKKKRTKDIPMCCAITVCCIPGLVAYGCYKAGDASCKACRENKNKEESAPAPAKTFRFAVRTKAGRTVRYSHLVTSVTALSDQHAAPRDSLTKLFALPRIAGAVQAEIPVTAEPPSYAEATKLRHSAKNWSYSSDAEKSYLIAPAKENRTGCFCGE